MARTRLRWRWTEIGLATLTGLIASALMVWGWMLI